MTSGTNQKLTPQINHSSQFIRQTSLITQTTTRLSIEETRQQKSPTTDSDNDPKEVINDLAEITREERATLIALTKGRTLMVVGKSYYLNCLPEGNWKILLVDSKHTNPDKISYSDFDCMHIFAYNPETKELRRGKHSFELTYEEQKLRPNDIWRFDEVASGSKQERHFKEIINETKQILSDYRAGIDRFRKMLEEKGGVGHNISLNNGSSVKQIANNILVFDIKTREGQEIIKINSDNYTIKNYSRVIEGKGVLTDDIEILPNSVKAVLRAAY